MEGLRIFNDNNSIQISTDFLDMRFTGSRYLDSTTARSVEPFFAVISETDYHSPSSGSGMVYEFTTNYLDKTNTEKIGLELYGADGNVYYNSNYKSMSVIDKIILTVSKSTPLPLIVKNYGNKKVAVLLIKDFAFFYFNQGNRTNVVFGSAYKQDAGGVLSLDARVNGEIYTGGDPTSTPSDSDYLEFLVIDVTNY